MTTTLPSFQYLRFVPFAGLDAWGFTALFADTKHAAQFPIVQLRELVSHRKGFIRIDDTKTYSRCRVQLRAQGVVLRDQVPGSAIKTKQQQICCAGDFLVAEIDAKLGGFGIVPPDLDGAVVSSHYFLFETNEARLSREYLALCLRTDYFQRQVQATGSTNYAAIRPAHVLGYTIPLPPLAEQKRLVAAHCSALGKAAVAEARATAQQQEANHFLETALGLKTETAKAKLSSGILHFVRFATLERWGGLFLGSTDIDAGGGHPLVRLGDVIADLQNGWSPKCLGRPATADEWGVLKLGAITQGAFDDAANKALPANLKPLPKNEIHKGDVLITRGSGAPALVGSCVLVKSCRPRLMLSDLTFRVVFGKGSRVSGEFLTEILRSRLVRRQIENISQGASTSMKKVTKPTLLNLRFPLPPLVEQCRIVERLDALRQAARQARIEAESVISTANQIFETALFGVAASS